VHCNIDFLAQERLLKLFGEEAGSLGGRFMERHHCAGIARGGDDLLLDQQPRMSRFKRPPEECGLGEGKVTPACAKDERT
jgi:hypothetical protein